MMKQLAAVRHQLAQIIRATRSFSSPVAPTTPATDLSWCRCYHSMSSSSLTTRASTTAASARSVASQSPSLLPPSSLLSPSSSSCRSFASSRRLRRARDFIAGTHRELPDMTPQKRLTPPSLYSSELEAEFHALDEPYDHGLESFDAYLQTVATLSPWVPTPDVVARKILDVAHAGPGDVHVDLGSGDGRLCFRAVDSYNVDKSIGIDADEVIVNKARERLQRRHPPPTNLEFVVADLLDAGHPVWTRVQEEATIITMYFAEEGLRVVRPLLEDKLAGRECTIITCGYEMPDWTSRMQEVVLGTQIHRYDWGTDDDDDDALFQFMGEDILQQKPERMLNNPPLENDSKFSGSTVIDRTRDLHPLLDPESYMADSDYDSDDEDWPDQIWGGEEEDEDENEKEKIKVNQTKGCAKTGKDP